ncbi:MAG TPA: MBL fold metallo-hydrolase [Bacteroidia bacterium]|nr:MBL fold metallo-hydrolase [Bacteroidia bacterium]
MSLQIASLNSGSNGNCYYIANENEAVLVDVGISLREIERRMIRIGLNMQKVKAIFISHEHIDHIRGVEATSRRYSIPVYISEGTLRNTSMKIDAELVRSFDAHTAVAVGDLAVIGFGKRHDAADPYSFVVEGNGVSIGVMTDIGSVCENVSTYFKCCHAVFLEANYDEEMLANGRYPEFLKDRIRGDRGHLSNAQALELFLNHRAGYLGLVLLSHLSRDNNNPKLAQEFFATHAGNTKVVVASRDTASQVYTVTAESVEGKFDVATGTDQQYSLF